MKLRFIAALCASLALAAVASVAQARGNPGAVAYRQTTNVLLYAKATGLMVPGRCNRNNSVFQTVRQKGGEVLVYIIPIAVPDNFVCTLDQQFYMGNYGAVPLWPFPTYGQRILRPGNHLADIRAGSKWSNFVVAYVEKLMRDRKFDGVFIDSCGGRPWSSYSNWTKWPTSERDAWTKGCVDLVRRIDAKRRALNPNFIVINNNVWDRTDGSKIGLAAHQYIDGVSLEHPANPSVAAYHRNYAAKTFSNLGHRRVFVIARSVDDARAWATQKGVTHVSSQAKEAAYAYPTVPPVGFTALYDR
jgi:hypothetical protein